MNSKGLALKLQLLGLQSLEQYIEEIISRGEKQFENRDVYLSELDKVSEDMFQKLPTNENFSEEHLLLHISQFLGDSLRPYPNLSQLVDGSMLTPYDCMIIKSVFNRLYKKMQTVQKPFYKKAGE